IDGWALAAYGVFVVFIIINILSSCYDYYLLRQQTSGKIDFYKRDFKISAHKLLTSFSLYRNFYRLTRPLPQEYEQLKFLNGYRFVCIFMMVAVHSKAYLAIAPIQNIIEVEDIEKSPAVNILQGGPVIMQTFFLITAFLLKLKFNDLHLVTPQTKMSKCCNVFAKVLALRYLRFFLGRVTKEMVQSFLHRGVIAKTKSTIIIIKFSGSYSDQMPELYKLDDYDNCISRTQSVYCMVYAEIVPDHSSKLWNFIEVYSKDYRHHFRHDHLFFGICVDRCEILLETLSLPELSELYDQRIESSEVCS
uniref:Acyltransferase 3 domain-containing protein n=1 Tax=Glossina palpalis gambiensis TaxID=67801 RepID=A0A1B0BC11_9MUSC